MTLTEQSWRPREDPAIALNAKRVRREAVTARKETGLQCANAGTEQFDVPIHRIRVEHLGIQFDLPTTHSFPFSNTRNRTAARSLLKPDFFIVGAPKCGTTALTHYLAAHPDIFMAQKELHAFGTDLQFGAQFYRRDLQTYLKEFASRKAEHCAGEASVWYLFSKQAAAEIKAFNPQARIIIMLRDPAEMLQSLYYQFRFDGNEHLASFEEALAVEPERRAGALIGRRAYFPQGLLYRETVAYTEQVRRYFDVFARDRVLVLLYDEFSADPTTAYRKTLDFLGVDSSQLDVPFKVINGAKRIRSRVLNTLLTEPWLRRVALCLRPCLPQKVFRALRQAEAKLRQRNTIYQQRPPVPAALRQRLKREFSLEVENLSQLLGRDLTYWSR